MVTAWTIRFFQDFAMVVVVRVSHTFGMIIYEYQVKPKQCCMCSKDSERKCKHCAGSAYCSLECKRADWAVHHILCNSLQQHPTPPSDPSTRRGIFFPFDSSTPEFVWVNVYTTLGIEHVRTLEPYLGSNDNNFLIIRNNIIRSRCRFADHVQLFLRDADPDHDLPLNQSVALFTGGLACHSWRGGMLAMKVHVNVMFSHMDTVDFRDLVDFFRSYMSGVHMDNENANPRHTGPASILEERLILEAAQRLDQFQTTLVTAAAPPPLAVELPDLQGVIIRHDPPHDGDSGKGSDSFETVMVPSTDAVWSNPVTSISKRLGMPLKTRIAREHHPENQHLNEAAMSLHTSVDDPDSQLWGRAPYPIDGSVLVVHGDQMDLSPLDLEALCSYCKVFLASYFDESRQHPTDRALKNRIIRHLSKASLQSFLQGLDNARHPENSLVQYCAGLISGLGL